MNRSSPISPNVSYDPYASLHPGFHKYTQPSFSPPSHANPLTPSTSAYTFTQPASQSRSPFIYMTLSVPFAALPDPIIHEHVRQYALKVETLVKKGLYNEYPFTINLKCNEVFNRGFPKKMKRLPTNAKLNMFLNLLNLHSFSLCCQYG